MVVTAGRFVFKPTFDSSQVVSRSLLSSSHTLVACPQRSLQTGCMLHDSYDLDLVDAGKMED
jgi:hypothetical protein